MKSGIEKSGTDRQKRHSKFKLTWEYEENIAMSNEIKGLFWAD